VLPQKVRTETCPLFLKRITLEALWTLLLLAFVHWAVARWNKGQHLCSRKRCEPKPVRFWVRRWV